MYVSQYMSFLCVHVLHFTFLGCLGETFKALNVVENSQSNYVLVCVHADVHAVDIVSN